MGADHPQMLASMNNLALAYEAAGNLNLALPLFEETLKLTKGKLGADHPHTLASMNNLALAYEAAGKLNLALPLFEETLKLRRAKLGADHADTLASLENLVEAHLSEAAHQAWFGREKSLPKAAAARSNSAKARMIPSRSSGQQRPAAFVHAATKRVLSSRSTSPAKRCNSAKGTGYFPYFQLTLGMCEFRNGRWAEADGALVAAMKAHTRDPHIWLTSAFYRAMNLFRQGKQDKARKLATAASLNMTKFCPLPLEQKFHYQHDDLIIWMAYKEAKELLHLESVAPEKLAHESEAIAKSQSLALAYLSEAAQQAWLRRDKEYAETCRRALELGKTSSDPALSNEWRRPASCVPTSMRRDWPMRSRSLAKRSTSAKERRISLSSRWPSECANFAKVDGRRRTAPWSPR